MRFRKGARLDASQVRDVRGRGGIGPMGPAGTLGAGGGIVGIIITVVVLLLNQGGGTNALGLGSVASGRRRTPSSRRSAVPARTRTSRRTAASSAS